MNQKLLLTVLGIVLVAGLGILLLPSVFGQGGSAQVSWSPEDEVTIQGDTGAEPETVGPGGDLSRVAVDAPKPAAASEDADLKRPMIGVHGRVVDSGRVPIAGAQVVLQLNGGFRGGPFGGGGRGGRGADRQQVNKPVVTGKDGTFAFSGRGFENPTITLVVAHPGHAVTIFDKEFMSKGGELDVGDVTMTSGGSILGAVTDVDGNAVPGTTANLIPSGGNRLGFLRNRDELIPKIVVDQSGTFRIVNVMPGEYRIEATAPRKISDNTDTFTVTDGQEERLEPLRLGPGHELRGLVVNQQGAGVASAEVVLNAIGRGRDFQTQTDKKGEFVIDHVPAEPAFSLRVQAKGYVTHSQPNLQPATTNQVVVRLQDGLKITGIVRDQQNSEPVKRYAAKARRVGGVNNGQNPLGLSGDQQAMRDQFRRMMDGSLSEEERTAVRAQFEEMRNNWGGGGPGGGRGNGGGRRGGGGQASENGGGPGGRRGGNVPDFVRGMLGGEAAANLPQDPGEVVDRPDGTFSFTGLDEGTYVIDIGSPNHQKARSERVVVQTGGTAPNLTIFLQAGLDLSGKVVSSADRAGIAGARVELVMVASTQPQAPAGSQPNDRDRGGRFRQMFQGAGPQGFPVAETRSGKDGEFSLKHLPPGRYQLVAQATGHSRRVGEPFDLSTTLAGVGIELGALAALEGKVLNLPKGKEESAHVVVFGGFQSTKTERVSSDGTYRVDDLEPGNYIVRAFLGDMRTFMRLEMQTRGISPESLKPDVTLQDGERKVLDLALTLHPLGQVAGNVQKNGLPAKGLRAILTSADAGQGGQDPNAAPQGPRGGGRGGPGGPGGGGRGGRGFGGGFVAPVVTDGRGDFLFTDVPEGRYILRIQPNGTGQDLWRTDLTVRAEDTQRFTVSLQTGGLSGRVKTDEKNPGDLSGNVMLYAGTKTVPTDMAEFQKSNSMFRLQLRAGVFSISDIPTGEYLLVLQVRNREPVQQNVFVPLGDTLNVEMAPGAKRASATPANGQRGAPNSPGQAPQRQNR